MRTSTRTMPTIDLATGPPPIQDLALLSMRTTLGGYLAAHGAQKLFGSFGGHGLQGTGSFFEQLGLTPGRRMAALAGVSELGGGLLTALGLGGPIGPATIASTMVTAIFTAHRGKGAFSMTGGPELPIADLSAAAVLAALGPGSISLDRVFGVRVPRSVSAAVVLGSLAMAAIVTAQAIAASGASARAAEEAVDVTDDAASSSDGARDVAVTSETR